MIHSFCPAEATSEVRWGGFWVIHPACCFRLSAEPAVAVASGDRGYRQGDVARAAHPHGAAPEQQHDDLLDRRARSVVGRSFEGSPEAAAAAVELLL